MTEDKKPADEAETETTAEAVPTPAEETLPDDDNPIVEQPDDAAADPEDPDAGDTPDDEAETKPEVLLSESGKPLSGAALHAARKKADKVRRDAAIEEVAAETPEPSEEVLAEDERRNKIADKLIEIDDEVQEIDARAAKLRKKQGKLMQELYPPAAGNDLHSTAVKGYLAASARERTHRALAPQRMKAMLKQMGLSPIDAAMQRKAARGMQRPRRKLAKQAAAPGQEQAPGGTPDKTVEPTE